MISEPRNAQLEALRQALPRLLGNLDDPAFEAIRPHLVWEWIQPGAGEILFSEGDPSDAIYLVVGGRLQARVASRDGEPEVVGEIGRGESVGEMGAFTGEPRRATVVALRDSLLARFERSAFHEMLKASPALTLNFGRVIIDRLQRRNASQKPLRNVTTLAVLAISDGVKPGPLLHDLRAELQRQQQTVLHLTSEVIDAAAGRPGAAQATEAEPEAYQWLVHYLDELEGRYSLLLLETDPTFNAWTSRCLRQADEVLLLGHAGALPDLSSAERTGLAGPAPSTLARQTLVLLHATKSPFATGTPAFLAARPKVYRHFHVRVGEKQDLGRLARFLSGRAVGLVLPGGGARGLSHIGVFRALEEAGVPVDAFGGTSVGSVLAACMASDWGWERVFSENRREFLSNPTSDFNLIPLVSLLAGRKLDRILERSFSGVQIEELWLPFFCVSSSYTRACEVLHARGPLKRALLASMAIPGVFPPVANNRDLLVDGGVFNNMPVDVMARTGVRTILAVDLRPQERAREITCDQVPGGWTLLMDRLKPRGQRRYQIPTLISTLMATNTLNSQQKMNQVMGDVDLMFNPDVRGFGMLEWKSYDRIVERGYRHAQKVLAKHPWPFQGLE